jgi:hypothetical protein
MQHLVADGIAAFANGARQGNDRCLSSSKWVEFGACHAVFVLIEQSVVKTIFVTQRLGGAALQIEDALQPRREVRVLVCLARLGPLFLRQAGDARNSVTSSSGSLVALSKSRRATTSKQASSLSGWQAAVLALGGFQQTRGFVTRKHLVRIFDSVAS